MTKWFVGCSFVFFTQFLVLYAICSFPQFELSKLRNVSGQVGVFHLGIFANVGWMYLKCRFPNFSWLSTLACNLLGLIAAPYCIEIVAMGLSLPLLKVPSIWIRIIYWMLVICVFMGLGFRSIARSSVSGSAWSTGCGIDVLVAAIAISCLSLPVAILLNIELEFVGALVLGIFVSILLFRSTKLTPRTFPVAFVVVSFLSIAVGIAMGIRFDHGLVPL